MVIQERYVPLVVGVNATIRVTNQSVAGFICQTTGTITLASLVSDGQPALTILNAFPVTAGIYYPMPLYLGQNGGNFTTAGGASGTLCA